MVPSIGGRAWRPTAGGAQHGPGTRARAQLHAPCLPASRIPAYVTDLARVLVAASLVALAASSLGLAIALLVARRRSPVRSGLATTLTFACLALAAAAAV